MIEALKKPSKHHLYITLVGKSGQHMPKTKHDDTRRLLELCERRAVDQEAVSVEAINAYALQPLIHDDLCV
jgi:hypothetical protein